MGWRVFIGQSGEWAHVDEQAGSWDAARDRLRSLADEFLGRELDDRHTCYDCVQAAEEVIEALTRAAPDRPFAGELDGEDWRIVEG